MNGNHGSMIESFLMLSKEGSGNVSSFIQFDNATTISNYAVATTIEEPNILSNQLLFILESRYEFQHAILTILHATVVGNKVDCPSILQQSHKRIHIEQINNAVLVDIGFLQILS